jgi:hypothetical protein
MAGDRDLLPGAYRIEQSRQMGLGLEGANAAQGLLGNQLDTNLMFASRSRHQANLNRQRTSTVVNSIPGTLRVLLGATIVAAFLRTIRRHFQ